MKMIRNRFELEVSRGKSKKIKQICYITLCIFEFKVTGKKNRMKKKNY